MAEATLSCRECGVETPRTSNNKRYCAPCARAVNLRNCCRSSSAAYAAKPKRMFKCQRCESEFASRKGRNQFCSHACWYEAEKAKLRRRNAEAGLKVDGSSGVCPDCGGAFTLVSKNNVRCSPCQKAERKRQHAKWRSDNPEAVADLNRRRDAKPSYREWRTKHGTEYSRRRRRQPRHALDHRMSSAIYGCLKARKSGRKWEALVGYSLVALMTHIERQFSPGMGWHNMGKWHVDHITPKSAFQYHSPEDAEFKQAWALTNLRPLWAKTNLSKGARIELLL